jgi:hypothetical protein
MQNLLVNEVIDSFTDEQAEQIKMGAYVSGIFGPAENTTDSGESELNICTSQGKEMDEYVNPLTHHISFWVPFIIDNRKIPKFFQGFRVDTITISTTEPAEFDFGDREDVSWEEWRNPKLFEDFVNRCENEIRLKLGNPEMTRDEILDALAYGDFKKYSRDYEREKLNRLIR